FNAANLNNNLRIVALTATVATVIPDSGTMVAEGPVTGSTVTAPGKITWVPKSGHTNDSFFFDDYHVLINESERFYGQRVNTIGLTLPATGMSTCAIDFLGKTMLGAAGEYFTSPADETSTGICQAVNGALRVGAADLLNVTGGTLNINGNMSDAAVVGSNFTPDVFPGPVVITGQITAFFEDVSLRDIFALESEVAYYQYLKADGDDGGEFLNYIMPRVKVGGSGKDGGAQGIIQTVPFQALYNSAGGAGIDSEQTTLMIQDSAA